MLKVSEGIVEQNWATPYEVAKDVGIAIVEAYKKLWYFERKVPGMQEWYEPEGVGRNTFAAMITAAVKETMKTVCIGSYGDIKEGIEWGFKALDDFDSIEDEMARIRTFNENLYVEFGKRAMGQRIEKKYSHADVCTILRKAEEEWIKREADAMREANQKAEDHANADE